MPLFNDGTYVRLTIEVLRNTSYSKNYKGSEQRVQHGNAQCEPDPANGSAGGPSYYYVSLHVEHVGYQDLPSGDSTYLIWNPVLEARPRHLPSPSTTQVPVVMFPPGTKPPPALKELTQSPQSSDAEARPALPDFVRVEDMAADE